MKKQTKKTSFFLAVMLSLSFQTHAFNIFHWVGLKITSTIFGSVWRHIKLAMPYPDVEILYGPIEQKLEEVKKELTDKMSALLTAAQNNNAELTLLNAAVGAIKTKFDIECKQITDKIALMKNKNEELVTAMNTKFSGLKQWSTTEFEKSKNDFETWAKKVRYANHLFNQQTMNRKNLFEARFNQHKLDYEARLNQMKASTSDKMTAIGEQITEIKNEMTRIQENASQMQPQLDELADKIAKNNEKNMQEIKSLNGLLESIGIQVNVIGQNNSNMFKSIDDLVFTKSLFKPASLITTFGQIKSMSKSLSTNDNPDLNLN
jgi:hypothetical protein